MINPNEIDRVEGSTAYDTSGDKVGKVGQLYLDDETGQPEWVTVSTGFFGSAETFVPLEGASLDGGNLRLGFDKDRIKNAPRVGADQHLDAAQEDELYRYYGLGAGLGTTTGQTYAETTDTTTAGFAGTGHDVDTTRTTDTEAAVTLAEERLQVGKESVESGRVRLRKYVTTETQTVSVPVSKEKLVIERVPAEGTTAGSISDVGEQIEEITLREERAVVGKETVAVEEVRVGKEVITESQQVSGEVRKEHADLDVEGDITDTTSATGTTGTAGTTTGGITGQGGLGR
jgi:uncharacterized protein (TIGR02271 family)